MNAQKLVAICLAVVAIECSAADLPCDLLLPQRVGNKIQLQFQPRHSWDINPTSYPRYTLVNGVLFHLNTSFEAEPIQLENGEAITMYVIHHSCTLQAVIGEAFVGLVIRERVSLPGIPMSDKYEFISVEKRP